MNRMQNNTEESKSAMGVDQVYSLAIRWTAARMREREFEQEASDAIADRQLSEGIYYTEANKDAGDEADAILGMLSFVKATSLVGAEFQLVEALNIVDYLQSISDDPRLNDKITTSCRTLKRLLYSAINYIEDQSETKLKLLMPQFLNPQLDPWTPVEERIAALRVR